ncbi:MAG: hypothetical protein AD073_000297 [Mycoplasmataceae bacterium]|nr:MAG: hypothetical protein AD073_000297 [Mycoplasmataceae bacterium]
MLYCSFIKQIGGGSCRWNMNMIDTCNLFEENGLKNCKSVINTGNFIFESDNKKIELDITIRELLNNFYKQEIDVFTQSKQEVINMYESFFKIFPQIDKNLCYNIFITNVKDYGDVIIEQFNNSQTENEVMILKDNICYWKTPKHYLKSDFYKKICRKNFKGNYTLRTIGTIEKVMKRFNEKTLIK